MSTQANEWEAMPELGPAHECEGECEFEDEAVFGSLAGGVPALREVALGAAGAALEALGEYEWEAEGEWEVNPVRKVYPDAALEHLAHAAMHAESEAEAAEAFLPLIPMVASRVLPLAARALPAAARALPRVTSALSRVTPQLTRGVTQVAGKLFRNPQTRGLLRAMPTIARRTVGALARQAARGAPVTPQQAVRTLARQTAGVLGCPPCAARAVRRSRAVDRVYHRTVAPALGVAPAGGVMTAGARVGARRAAMPVAGGVVGPRVLPRSTGGCQCRCRACPCCGR